MKPKLAEILDRFVFTPLKNWPNQIIEASVAFYMRASLAFWRRKCQGDELYVIRWRCQIIEHTLESLVSRSWATAGSGACNLSNIVAWLHATLHERSLPFKFEYFSQAEPIEVIEFLAKNDWVSITIDGFQGPEDVTQLKPYAILLLSKEGFQVKYQWDPLQRPFG